MTRLAQKERHSKLASPKTVIPSEARDLLFLPFPRLYLQLRSHAKNYADADFTCVNAAATSLISGTTGMS